MTIREKIIQRIEESNEQHEYIVHSQWISGKHTGKKFKTPGRTFYNSENDAIANGRKYSPVDHVFKAGANSYKVIGHSTRKRK